MGSNQSSVNTELMQEILTEEFLTENKLFINLIQAILDKDLNKLKDAIQSGANKNQEFIINREKPELNEYYLIFKNKIFDLKGNIIINSELKYNCAPLALCIIIDFPKGFKYLIDMKKINKEYCLYNLMTINYNFKYHHYYLKKYNHSHELNNIKYIINNKYNHFIYVDMDIYKNIFNKITKFITNDTSFYKPEFIKDNINRSVNLYNIQSDVISELKKYGADETTIFTNNYTMLHYAVIFEDINEVRNIIKKNPNNINNKTFDTGRTALIMAAVYDKKEIYNLLLNHTNIENDYNETKDDLLLTYEEIKDNLSLIDKDIKDDYNKTADDYIL